MSTNSVVSKNKSYVTTAKPRSARKLTCEELEKLRQKDNKIVKGVFRCFEPRGGSITFSFKKYKGDPISQYTLLDGDTYDLPLMVAKHLNSNCWYPKHTHVLDSNGHPSVEIGKKVQRCSFESLEFQELREAV